MFNFVSSVEANLFKMTIKKYILFSFLVLPLFLSAQSTEELKDITDKIIAHDTEIDFKKRTPGLIAGMIDNDSTYIINYGSTTWDSLVPMTQHTIFEIGSLSKVFTMSLLSVLKDEGSINYNTPVNELVPEPYQNKKIGDKLLLKHLITHTAGLPRLPKDFGLKQSNPNDPYADYTKEDLLTFYSTFPFHDWDETQYLYSHVNFALIEVIIEYITQKSYREVLKEKLLDPLGLIDTELGITEKIIKNSAKGYSISGREVNQKTFSSFEGSMGIKSSLHDLLMLTKAHLGFLDEKYKNIFSENWIERVGTGVRQEVSVGYAWHILKQRKFYNVIVHPGRISGHQVSLHFVPETKTAVIVMSNSDNTLDNLGYMMLALVNNHWKKTKKDKKKDKKS